MKYYPIYIDRDARQMYLKTTEKVDFENKTISVCGEKINVGDYSDLHGFYLKKLKYLGFYEDFAVFELGTESQLFGEIFYYDLLHIVSDDTIALYLKAGNASSLYYNKKCEEWK
jgi:hypothetical protein